MNGFVVSNTIAQDVQMSNTGKNIFRLARGCVRESKAQRIGPQIVLVPPNQERSPESEIQLANDARMIQGLPVGNHKILGSLYLYAADGWNELFEVIEPTHIVTQSDIQLLEFSVDGVS